MEKNINKVGDACCGCLLCVSECPTKAIDTVKKNGFFYPSINSSLCVSCGKCLSLCPVINDSDSESFSDGAKIFLAYNKNEEERKRSTSGGVFIALAEFIVSGGGVVYGAQYQNDWTVAHTRADSLDKLRSFQGSKYVQSNILNCYNQVCRDLNGGKTVLFTGTPCQINAVKNCVSQMKENGGKLITAEILCYGVPSPSLFQAHIRLIEEKNGKVKSYIFRDERKGWGNKYIHSARLKNGSELYDTKILRALSELYSSHHIIRESCFSCKYANTKRIADITLGDCWGIDNIMPEMHDKYGISQIWCNTETGFELWKNVENQFEYKICSLDKILPFNTVLSAPAERPLGQKLFWKIYNKFGYKYILNLYTINEQNQKSAQNYPTRAKRLSNGN